MNRITDKPVDLVVNNAGFGTSGEFHTLDAERMSDEIALNVTALTRISRAALGVMVRAGRGYLLNVSSVAGFQPAPKLAVYAATKAYVTSLSESLHEEVRGTRRARHRAVPGPTRTEFQSVSRTDSYTTEFPSMVWMIGGRGGRGRSRATSPRETHSRCPARSTRCWRQVPRVAPRTLSCAGSRASSSARSPIRRSRRRRTRTACRCGGGRRSCGRCRSWSASPGSGCAPRCARSERRAAVRRR